MDFKYKYLKYKKKYLELKKLEKMLIGGEDYNVKELKKNLKTMIIEKFNLYKFEYNDKDINDKIDNQYDIFEQKNEDYKEKSDPQARYRPNYVIFEMKEIILYLFDIIINNYDYNYIEKLKKEINNIENVKIGLSKLQLSTEEDKKLIIKDNYMTLFYIFKMIDLKDSYKDILSLVIEYVNYFIDSKIESNLKNIEGLNGGSFISRIKKSFEDRKILKSLKKELYHDKDIRHLDREVLIKINDLDEFEKQYNKIKEKYNKQKEEAKRILERENDIIKRFINYIDKDTELFENSSVKENAKEKLNEPWDGLRDYILKKSKYGDIGNDTYVKEILEQAKNGYLREKFISEYTSMLEKTIEMIKNNKYKDHILVNILKFNDNDIEKYYLDILIFLYESYKEKIFLRFDENYKRIGEVLVILKKMVNKN